MGRDPPRATFGSFFGRDVGDSNGNGAQVGKARGAGGAELYNTRQDDKPETWQPFTKRMVSDRHSLTVLDLNGKRGELRQLGEDRKEIDHFVLTQ